MYRSSDFVTQPGLRRVLDAAGITAAEMEVTPDLEPSIADRTADNVVYLADVRNRDCHHDDPSVRQVRRPAPPARDATSQIFCEWQLRIGIVPLKYAH